MTKQASAGTEPARAPMVTEPASSLHRDDVTRHPRGPSRYLRGPSRHRASTVIGGDRAGIEQAPAGTVPAPGRHRREPSRHRRETEPASTANRAVTEPAQLPAVTEPVPCRHRRGPSRHRRGPSWPAVEGTEQAPAGIEQAQHRAGTTGASGLSKSGTDDSANHDLD